MEPLNPTEKYNNYADIRAEVMAADYIDEGLRLRNLVIRPVGSYKRPYSRDVLHSHLQTDETGHPSKLEISVSRDGLYDMIPEGLFHQPDPDKRTNKVQDVVDNIKKTRREEDEARQFFLAIEKEIYRQKVLIEIEERKAYEDYSDHYRNDLFFQIWPDLVHLKREFVNPLVQILPKSYDICGNIPLTEYCFQKVLGVDIQIDTIQTSTHDLSDYHATRLGNAELGVDMFAGDVMVNFLPTIVICIGPLMKTQIPEFIHGGAAAMAVEVLCNYLLPVEAEVKVELKLDVNEEALFLKTEKHEAILGFSSRI
jgi:hypothetical protein